MAIDVVIRRLLHPRVTGAVPHADHLPRGVIAFSATQGGGRIVLHRHHFNITGAIDRLARHIAGASIPVMRDHQHLLAASRQIEIHILRQHLQPNRPRLRLLVFGAFSNPLPDCLVVFRPLRQNLSTLVRHFSGRLLEHQAPRRIDAIKPPPAQIVD